MKTSRIILSIALLATATANKAAAQSIDDGLRMSQEYPTGTARFVSMGGAFGALGSDFSSIDVNPAGLGVYRSSEFTFTPSFSSTKSRSTYLGSREIETARGFSIDNMGFVLSTSPSGNPEKGVSQLNFSFGYNRSNTFKANTLVKGRSESSSILDYFAAQAMNYNIPPDDLAFWYDSTGAMDWDPTVKTNAPWSTILAWNTYLLDYGSDYFAPLDETLGTVEQKQRSTTSGNNGTYNLSMGMSIANKLYLGLSMGILTHKHEELIKYQEDADPTNAASTFIRFNYMDYIRDFSSSGSGINAKLGAIFTPTPMLRFGLSVHTPTFYTITHRYSHNMTSNVDTNGVTINSKLKKDQLDRFTGHFKYKFETPFRLVGSAAVVLGQLGLVSVDVEHVNYSSMKFRNVKDDDDDLSDLNEMAKETYRNVFNLKLGGEMVLGNVALRAGYAFYPSPYRKIKDEDQQFLNQNSHSHLMSIGAGYCTNIGFFIDAAYQQALSVNKYRLYEWTDDPKNYDKYNVKSNYSTGKFVLTCGFRF